MISRCLCELNAYSIGSSLIGMAEMQVVPIFSSLGLRGKTGGHCAAALEREVYLKDGGKSHLAVSTSSPGCRKSANLLLTFFFPPQQPFSCMLVSIWCLGHPKTLDRTGLPVLSPALTTGSINILFCLECWKDLSYSSLSQLWQHGCIILSSVCWFTGEREGGLCQTEASQTRSEAPGVSVCNQKAASYLFPGCSFGNKVPRTSTVK